MNLFDTVADDRHRLKIVGLLASLDFVELIIASWCAPSGKSDRYLSKSPRKGTPLCDHI